MPQDTPPLGPLRILDFSRILAGPFATMMLADLGADVLKVERPGAGDETRSWGPPFDAQGRATYFQSVNRNKHSVVLDLTAEADLARARELAREADVVVENFRPDVMDKLGLGYERLSAENPRPHLLLDHRLRRRRGRRAARLRPARPGARRPDEHHRVPGGRAPEGRRRAGGHPGRAVRLGRDPGRAAPPRPHRRGPARGGQPALGAAGRARQPGVGIHDRRQRAEPDGQRPPQHLALRAVPHRRRRPRGGRRQRAPVRRAVRGARTRPSWPPTRALAPTQTASPTAPRSRPSSSRAWRPHPRRSGRRS